MAKHIKTAVDSKAEAYWTNYFGEYGRMFVRNIPRTIKAALLPDFRRSANADARKVRVTSTDVIPLGHGVTASNGLVVEGVARVEFVEAGQPRVASRLFRAEFNATGKMLDFEHRNAPSV